MDFTPRQALTVGLFNGRCAPSLGAATVLADEVLAGYVALPEAAWPHLVSMAKAGNVGAIDVLLLLRGER